MFKNHKRKSLVALCALTVLASCNIPKITQKEANKAVPQQFQRGGDITNIAQLHWDQYFSDPYLVALIDTALHNNQELNITLQEIIIAKNEVRARKGEYLPFVGLKAGAGVDKVARYTNIGAMEDNTDIEPGKKMPEPLQDYLLAATASWEVDIWKKLRNAQKAAQARYLESIEGKNFVKTNLIAEVASSYYELLSLDRELEIVQQNIDIQSNALNIVKLQKEAARATELAVKKFEAEVLKTKSLKYGIQQEIVETENRINYLLGRFPQPIARSATTFDMQLPLAIQAGLPSQLLEYRPDIRKAELELNAAKLDVKVAKARFYPSVALSAGIGFQAFNPAYLTKLPESLLSSLAGDLMAPLVNRNAIKAAYYSAGARQVQAVYDYERTVVNAFAEVVNQMNQIQNLSESIALKKQQVAALTESINISNDLFRSARADYMEVLMTQRDALEAKFELIEARKKQLHTMVNVYKSLGGGWKE